jgi:hypothetical protein
VEHSRESTDVQASRVRRDTPACAPGNKGARRAGPSHCGREAWPLVSPMHSETPVRRASIASRDAVAAGVGSRRGPDAIGRVPGARRGQDAVAVLLYRNRGARPINARYVFPASTRAAVHRESRLRPALPPVRRGDRLRAAAPRRTAAWSVMVLANAARIALGLALEGPSLSRSARRVPRALRLGGRGSAAAPRGAAGGPSHRKEPCHRPPKRAASPCARSRSRWARVRSTSATSRSRWTRRAKSRARDDRGADPWCDALRLPARARAGEAPQPIAMARVCLGIVSLP